MPRAAGPTLVPRGMSWKVAKPTNAGFVPVGRWEETILVANELPG